MEGMRRAAPIRLHPAVTTVNQQSPRPPLGLSSLHAKRLLPRKQLLPPQLERPLPPLLLLLHLPVVAGLHGRKRQRRGTETVRLRAKLRDCSVQLSFDLHQVLDFC